MKPKFLFPLWALLFCSSAQADYMSTCSGLIEKWQQCEAAGDCAIQQADIEQTCKCHVLKNGVWRFVKPGSAGIGVCGDYPPSTPPTPSPEDEDEDANPPARHSGGRQYHIDDPKYYLKEENTSQRKEGGKRQGTDSP